MWTPKEYADLVKRLKDYAKRHRQETKNALDNANRYLTSLRAGLTPQQIVGGWVRSEPRGIKALTEAGPGNPRKAVRLYVYPEEDTRILHELTIGDKNTQSEDIKHCEEFVEQLIKNKTKGKANEKANRQAAG